MARVGHEQAASWHVAFALFLILKSCLHAGISALGRATCEGLSVCSSGASSTTLSTGLPAAWHIRRSILR